MHKQIQLIVKEALKGVNTRILFGTVEGVNPLSVKVDQRFYLPEELLIVPQRLCETKLEISYTNSSTTETKEYVIREGFSVGDSLIIINLEQRYLILDRVGDPNDVITITE